MIGTRCPECNTGRIAAVAKAGRKRQFRTVPDLELPADVVIPTCDDCGEEFLDRRTAEALDRVLEERYRALLLDKASAAIDRLKEVIPQRDLERLVGVSPGYLSKLRSGKETSAPLVALLSLLSRDPASRVAELREHWTTRGAGAGKARVGNMNERLEMPLEAPDPWRSR